MISEIKLHRGQLMTDKDITKQVNTARSGFDYLKITFYNRTYIQIFFARNYKVFIKTNIYNDLQLWRDIEIIERLGTFRLQVIVDFIFNTIKRKNI